MDTAVEGDDNPRSREPNSVDGGSKLERDDALVLGIVPDDDLCLWELRLLAAADERYIVRASDHLRDGDARIEVSRHLELAWFGVEDYVAYELWFEINGRSSSTHRRSLCPIRPRNKCCLG